MSFHKRLPIFLVSRTFLSLLCPFFVPLTHSRRRLHILALDHQHHVELEMYHKSQSEKSKSADSRQKESLFYTNNAQAREECQRIYFFASMLVQIQHRTTRYFPVQLHTRPTTRHQCPTYFLSLPAGLKIILFYLRKIFHSHHPPGLANGVNLLIHEMKSSYIILNFFPIEIKSTSKRKVA